MRMLQSHLYSVRSNTVLRNLYQLENMSICSKTSSLTRTLIAQYWIFAKKVAKERLMGFEGAGAAQYFSMLGDCLTNSDFVFISRSRRPPGNPVNAILSFGYQVLWNHLLALIELQGLDPYYGCLHVGNDGHAALASDLIEEFRAPIVDSLLLWLVNSRVIDAKDDFDYRDGGCFLNDRGRRKYLQAFLQRMEEQIQDDNGEKQPRWDLLTRQVKAYKQFVYNPSYQYQSYQIR
jgi:CRISP-associated protein Cas1